MTETRERTRTRTVTGVVERIVPGTTAKGDAYQLLRLVGQEDGCFDFRGRLAQAGVQPGDEVTVRASDSRYPRIFEIQKTGVHKPDLAAAARASREDSIVRQSCLKAAATVLANSSVPDEKLGDAVIALAERMRAWVNGEAK